MSRKDQKNFKQVTKVYNASDYNEQNEVSQGLATTHEQVSDAYMSGDILTHDPKYQNREDPQK